MLEKIFVLKIVTLNYISLGYILNAVYIVLLNNLEYAYGK